MTLDIDFSEFELLWNVPLYDQRPKLKFCQNP